MQGGFYAGDFFRSDRDSEVKTTRGMVIDQDFIDTKGLADLAALVVAQVTVSFQALKAANAHPADAIRSE